MNKGRPQSVVKDYARANRMMYLMTFKNEETGQLIIETQAATMVAQWEVLQRVLDVAGFLVEVAGLSREDASRIDASWGIDQRARAVGLLKHLRNYTIEDSERLIDDWNAQQKARRAKEFFAKKLGYSEARAQAIVTQLKIGELRGKDTTGKDAAIGILVQQHRYEDREAAKIVNSWGVTDISGSEDPSPISCSFRAVKEQGLWDLLNVAGHGNEEESQVLNLLLKPTLTKGEA